MSKLTKEELIEIYNKTDGQDREYFFVQLRHFREIMCSTKYSVEEKEKEFQCLAQSYLRCNLKEQDITLFQATAKEFEMRLFYEVKQ